jgi:hypothetical protein
MLCFWVKVESANSFALKKATAGQGIRRQRKRDQIIARPEFWRERYGIPRV